jgi:hypothetical protein
MAKKTSGTTGGASSTRPQSEPTTEKSVGRATSQTRQKPSALLDTRVIYCGDNLEQLANLPDACCVQLAFFTTATGTPATTSRSCSTRFPGKTIFKMKSFENAAAHPRVWKREINHLTILSAT